MRLVMVGILAVYAMLSVQQAAVWGDELSLWTAAVQQAPDKPRPHLQLALALLERRRFIDAQTVLDDTQWLLDQRRTIPPWDREEATVALMQNRLLLSRMAGTGPFQR